MSFERLGLFVAAIAAHAVYERRQIQQLMGRHQPRFPAAAEAEGIRD